MTKEIRDLLIMADREECAGYIRLARELRLQAEQLIREWLHA